MRKALVVLRGSLSTSQFVPSRSISCRVTAPLEYLQGLANSNFEFHAARIEDIQEATLSQYQAIIFCKHNTADSVELSKKAKGKGLEVIYDIDDLIYRFTKDSSAFSHMKNVDYLREHLESSDTVVISTPTLEKILKNDFVIKNSKVVPTGINVEKYHKEHYDIHSRDVLFTNGDSIKIAHSRNDFIKLFNGFLKNHPEINFEVFGDAEEYFRDFSRYNFLGSLPWDEHKLFLMKHQYAFAIIPLGAEEEDDEHKLFSSCKSPIKYLEYGALKIPGIYSDAFIYRNVIKNNETGKLVENTVAAWKQALEEFASNPSLRKKIADTAFEDVCQNHHIKKAAASWSEIL